MASSPSATLTALRERGCTCGLDDERGDPVGGCPVHVEPGDNRGLRAWFQAGMPESFPMSRVNCSRCYQGAQRCRDEAEKIVAACEAEDRDLTDDERAQLDLYAEGRVLSQADALMYPSPEQDAWAEEHDGEPTKHFPSTICPRCSTPAAERRLVAMVEAQGLHRLNDRRVFA